MQRVRVYSFEASLKFRIQIPPASNGHRQTASLHQTPDFCQHTILIRTLVARLYLLFFGPLFSWESYLVCVFLFFNSIKERRKKNKKEDALFAAQRGVWDHHFFFSSLVGEVFFPPTWRKSPSQSGQQLGRSIRPGIKKKANETGYSLLL